VVEGRVDGNLYGLERAELKKSATVVGDIYTPRIAIEDGAVLEGDVRVHKDAPRPQTKKEAATFSGRAKVAWRRAVINNSHALSESALSACAMPSGSLVLSEINILVVKAPR